MLKFYFEGAFVEGEVVLAVISFGDEGVYFTFSGVEVFAHCFVGF